MLQNTVLYREAENACPTPTALPSEAIPLQDVQPMRAYTEQNNTTIHVSQIQELITAAQTKLHATELRLLPWSLCLLDPNF